MFGNTSGGRLLVAYAILLYAYFSSVLSVKIIYCRKRQQQRSPESSRVFHFLSLHIHIFLQLWLLPCFCLSMVEQNVSSLKVLSVDGRRLLICNYHRDCKRIIDGLARMVLHLPEVHVLRDAWTKLNVHTAKIMQVCDVCIRIIIFTCGLL